MSYLLGTMEGMTKATKRTVNHRSVSKSGVGNRVSKPVRRIVYCDGVRGVLEQREGSWSVQNETEVRVLAALGGSNRAFDRLQALAATLNAGLIDRAGLTDLSRRLRAISEAENMSRVWIPDLLLPAVAFACAFLAEVNGARWLAWALSARLDGNLFRRSLPGPGWCTMTRYETLSSWGYDREIRWIDEMPDAFWDRLRVRRDCCAPDGPTDTCLSTRDRPCLRSVAAASNPRANPGLLRELAKSSDVVVLDLVASHPRTPAGALHAMVENGQIQLAVKLRVPQNRSASTWLLRRMAKSSMWQVRGLAAMNEAMPVSVLKELCRDEMEFVRSVVAGHESTPEEELRILSGDDEYSVRRAVAFNGSCPSDLLEKLLGDRKWQVRSAAVSNPNASLELVTAHAEDRAMRVRAALADRPDAPSGVLRRLAHDPKEIVRRAVAWNNNTPADALELLAAAPELHIRYRVGANTSTPAVVLASVAADSHWWVRCSVAHNANTPVEILDAMSTEDDTSIRQAVAENAATSADVLSALASDDCYWVRAAAAENASTPDAALRLLVTDEAEDVRIASACNPSISGELLQVLASDEDYRARAEAAENLNKRREPQENKESQQSTESQEKGMEWR